MYLKHILYKRIYSLIIYGYYTVISISTLIRISLKNIFSLCIVRMKISKNQYKSKYN